MAVVDVSVAPEPAPVDAQSILEVFWWFDKNGDGVISRQELRRVLKALNPTTWDDKSVEVLLEAADTKGDGVIQYKDFVNWLLGDEDDSVDQLKSKIDALKRQMATDNLTIEQETEAANELSESALPAVDEARAALANIQEGDLEEVAATLTGPEPMALVAQGVQALRPCEGIDSNGLEAARCLLQQPGLLQLLSAFKQDGITEAQVLEVRSLFVGTGFLDGTEFLPQPSPSQLTCVLPEDVVGTLPAGGVALLLWIRAMLSYWEAVRTVQPQHRRIEDMVKRVNLAKREVTHLEKKAKEKEYPGPPS